MRPNVMVDRISDLPHNVKDSILIRLKIKEAARTCILSRCWRYQCHSLSKLSVKYDSFCTVSESEEVKIIDHILLLHHGSIDKLELETDLGTHIDRWILYVSRNGIKELIINICADGYYNIPSCLFSCSDLTYLKLDTCMVGLPAASRALCNLTNLCLDNVIIDAKVLEKVIASCPILSQLELRSVELPSSFQINAPKLVMLSIFESNHIPRLMNTPLLSSVYFGLQCCEASANKDCNIVEIFGSMPVLQRLKLNRNALWHLAVGGVPACLPSVCPIKHLTLCIDLEYLQELQVAFCMLRSSSFVQKLKITIWQDKNKSRVSSDGFWRGEHGFSFQFGHLQTVKVRLLTGTERELRFIEFLLSKAPALKTMKIFFDLKVEDTINVVRELIRFPRISPNAQVILPPNLESFIVRQYC